MTIEINAVLRTEQGTSASRRLRRAEQVPGIIYGGGEAPQMVALDHNELFHKLRQEAFHSTVLSIRVGDTAQSVILKDVQRHAYKPRVLHVDFQRVDATHKIHLRVPLHFVNGDVCPGVKLQGGIISHPISELDVECLPGNLPEFIEVDLKDLKAGTALHVSHLALPEGVVALTHGDDPVVVTVLLPKGAASEEGEGESAA